MLNLQIHARNAPMQVLQIEQGCTIGKNASCDIVVRGMLIGKLQARIVREHNAYYIEDQGGIAATLVNGSPITRYGPLTEADQIDVGMTTIKIVRAVATTQQAQSPRHSRRSRYSKRTSHITRRRMSRPSRLTPPTPRHQPRHRHERMHLPTLSPPSQRPLRRPRRPARRSRSSQNALPPSRINGRPRRATTQPRANPRPKRGCAYKPRMPEEPRPPRCPLRRSTASVAPNCASRRT
jgi:pilus assembly protein CpaF